MGESWNGPLERIDEYRWLIPDSYEKGMRVAGLIYADSKMIEDVRQDQAPQQVANVAHLPGIVGRSMAMPDIHWGYGFPIGGVAGFDCEAGVISPGGVGYDINCGVRLVRTNLRTEDVRGKIEALIEKLFQMVPCGVGSTSKLRLSKKDEKLVLTRGSAWAVQQGFGWQEDVELTEERGAMDGADPDALSSRALERGRPQLGTLGSGNHFLEIQKVEEIFDEKVASIFGIEKGQIVVMIHTGSRGLGYQVCDDNIDSMVRAMNRYGIKIPDKQLACAPVDSPEGRRYFAAMAAAANYAWTNRQLILHWVRESFEAVFGESAERLGMHMIYDVAHNIAKFEQHTVGQEVKRLVVHRKGATRAFGPGHMEIPEKYRETGQPVLIPGDMGTASYILAGTKKAMDESLGSTCHGAGRVMSRRKALKATRGRSIRDELMKKGIYVQSRGNRTLFEEAPEAYKDIDRVVDIVHRAGLSKKVARMHPLGVVKG